MGFFENPGKPEEDGAPFYRIYLKDEGAEKFALISWTNDHLKQVKARANWHLRNGCTEAVIVGWGLYSKKPLVMHYGQSEHTTARSWTEFVRVKWQEAKDAYEVMNVLTFVGLPTKLN